MDPENPNIDYQMPLPPKPFHKRPWFWVCAVVVASIVYFGFQLGLAYHSIVIDNTSFLDRLAGAFNLGSKHTEAQKDNQNPLPSPEPDRLDILLMGIRGENDLQDGGLLTDTMLVVSIDRKTQKTALINIPRDLYIDITAQTASGKDVEVTGKINEAYERGLAAGDG